MFLLSSIPSTIIWRKQVSTAAIPVPSTALLNILSFPPSGMKWDNEQQKKFSEGLG